MKRMLLSLEKRKNRPVLSIYFTFTYYLLPITYYLMAASDSRRLLHGDKNFGGILTIESPPLTVLNNQSAGTKSIPCPQAEMPITDSEWIPSLHV